MIFKVLRFIILPLVKIFFPVKIIGRENLDKEQSGIFICNHLSMLDITYIAMLQKKKIYYIGKEELIKKRFWRWLLPKLGLIPVGRDGADAKAIIKTIKIIKDGNKVGLFPEGTRNKTGGDLLEFQGGAAIFAIKAKCKIQPLAILKKAKLFKRTCLIVGETFELSDYYGKKISAEEYDVIGAEMRERVSALKETLKEQVESKKKKGKKADNGNSKV